MSYGIYICVDIELKLIMLLSVTREMAVISPRKRRQSNAANMVKSNNGSTMDITQSTFLRYKNEEDNELRWPKRVNMYGSAFLIIYVVIFMIGYWWICINEYIQPPQKYIKLENGTSL